MILHRHHHSTIYSGIISQIERPESSKKGNETRLCAKIESVIYFAFHLENFVSFDIRINQYVCKCVCGLAQTEYQKLWLFSMEKKKKNQKLWSFERELFRGSTLVERTESKNPNKNKNVRHFHSMIQERLRKRKKEKKTMKENHHKYSSCVQWRLNEREKAKHLMSFESIEIFLSIFCFSL